jgi:uncharacterized integral membrane protein
MSDPTDPNQSTQPVRQEPEEYDEFDEPTAPVRPIVVPPPAAATAEPKKGFAQRTQETASNVARVLRILVLALIGAILGIFVVRNWNDVEFDFVFGDVEMPLAFMLLIFLGIGILIGMVLYWYLRRKAGR